jgi:pimeloyl-ACP methyl ester carboxylesterase
LLILIGEGLKKSVWNSTVKYLHQRGFNGMTMEIPTDIDDIDKVTDNIHLAIQKEKLNNPILITNSIGTFIAQKYLESASTAAVVLINPIPPQNYMKNIDKLIDSNYFVDSDTINKYKTLSYPKFIQNITNDSQVNIEPNACKMLVITTKGDGNVIDTDIDIKTLKLYHNIDDNDIIQLYNVNSRLPFITDPEICHKVIYDFIDTIY